MNADTLVTLIGQYGYAALFFCLWLGIIGMPIPDEAVVMAGGFAASLGLLHPVTAFCITYLGVISGLSIGYGLGRIMGPPMLNKLKKKKNIDKYLSKSYGLVQRYGSYSLCISYALPIVRHLVPYLVGIGRMPFIRYAFFSYTIGFIWTLAFFIIGRLFGKYIDKIGMIVHNYGLLALGVLLAGIVLLWVAIRMRSKPAS
ncbi:DedA family protein [Aneurinibacillus thermoaerophilus]|uniref:DedA family protein n=1 Tax=Aneurinibacillus thermoaerophilus TaxID=143495 RepID=A0A1G7ZK95_ANETH|nr:MULTISPECIES: DedA family protein [Aneurinibacillus]AMA72420.1 alkaline phosphatase [Aneurinibacillus sp. XH2]MED0758800.1 DedA family protein [Aneurinibacillus thermoaerophilus]MED0759424.1 DedA family protein [Aneurinibacillus thermoaerophilus]QYY41826.1 DedA family protein [Aneurinibacillus thermoaerophilus]SDH09104.1 membrane protein DedA, SNARE-associated domain [Aneurinibacillus thermoaerophilus]